MAKRRYIVLEWPKEAEQLKDDIIALADEQGFDVIEFEVSRRDKDCICSLERLLDERLPHKDTCPRKWGLGVNG